MREMHGQEVTRNLNILMRELSVVIQIQINNKLFKKKKKKEVRFNKISKLFAIYEYNNFSSWLIEVIKLNIEN